MKQMIVPLLALCPVVGCIQEERDVRPAERPATEAHAGLSDWRRGTGICELHKMKMGTVVVNGLAGPAPQMVPGYYEAKEQTFPNCGMAYSPELYSDGKGMIHVCPKCEEARENWLSTPVLAWDRAEGMPISFFTDMGFEFNIDDRMGHHYQEPTVEISIVMPLQFIDTKVKYELSSILFLSEEFSAYLDAHSHAGKKRSIVTISEDMVEKSQVIFYFKNDTKAETDDPMCILDLSKVLNAWEASKRKTPDK